MVRPNKNIPALLKELKKHYPDVTCALHFKNPLELLVATILSAQCTDQRVNIVTKDLFKKYKTTRDYAAAGQAEMEKMIRSTGFYRNKAKSIRGMAKTVLKKHKGAVPSTIEDLLELPGVARKTANVVLGTAFGKAEGVVVDTHVMRLAQRLGLSLEKDPKKIEKDLMEKIPRNDWIWFAHAMIHHGRRVCKAITPNCPECPVRKDCANPVR